MSFDLTLDVDRESYDFLIQIDRHPTLDEEFSELMNDFQVAGIEEVLDPIIDANDILIVAGAFFGDESKGKLGNAIAADPRIKYVVRVNSGENAGHTVMFDGQKYVLHLAPCGLFLPDKHNLIGPQAWMDPVNFMQKELQRLIDKGIKYNLTVGNVKIATPVHKLVDLLKNYESNASTIQGISLVAASTVMKEGLRLDHIFNSEDVQAERLKREMWMYNAWLNEKGIDEAALLDTCLEMNDKRPGRVPDHVVDFIREMDKVGYLVNLYRHNVKNNPNFPERGNVINILRDGLEKGEKALFELTQSRNLSNKEVTHWSSSTSADTTPYGALSDMRIKTNKLRWETFNVTKFPGSRVGRGANPSGHVSQTFFSERKIEGLDDLEGICEDFDGIQKQFYNSIQYNGILEPSTYTDKDGREYLINVAMSIAEARKHEECGATTLKPRILGPIDCVAHAHAMRDQGPYTQISALDRGDHYDKMGLIVAYVVHIPEGEQLPDSYGKKYKTGDIITARGIRDGTEEMPHESVLKYCYPIIRVFDGWKDTPIGGRKWKKGDALPGTLTTYLAAFKHYTGADVLAIGNGPYSEDMIYLQKWKPKFNGRNLLSTRILDGMIFS